MSAPIFIQLIGCVVYAAFNLLALDDSMKELNFDVYVCLDTLVCQICINFVYCRFAENLSTLSSNVSSVVYDLDWYKLPLAEQEFLLFSIRQAQKPFQLKGFKILPCTLENFLAVSAKVEKCYAYENEFNFYIRLYQLLRSSISYFLIIRQLKSAN